MTDLRAFLQDFDTLAAPPSAEASPDLDESALEAQRLESFEAGYRAGWEDALKAHSEDGAQVSAALAQQLQELSFTYDEAYGHMKTAIAPLLKDLVTSLLPKLARHTLGAHLVEQIEAHSHEIGKPGVEIAVSPAMLGTVSPMAEGEYAFPINVIADDTLSDEQADLRFGETERQIDLSGLIAAVTDAVDGFAHDNLRKLSNG